MDRERGINTDQRDRVRADEALTREGLVAPVVVPAGLTRMLGPERSARLGELVMDARQDLAYAILDREPLGDRATLLGAAVRELDEPLSHEVAVLEARLHTHELWLGGASARERELYEQLEEVPWWRRAERAELHGRVDDQRAYVDRHAEAVRAIRSELDVLAARDGHPDSWLERHGRQFARGLVARVQLEHERTLAGRAAGHGHAGRGHERSARELGLGLDDDHAL